MSVLSIEPITLEAIVRAGKRRWGGEHLVAGEGTDGIRHDCWLFAERDGDLHPLCEAPSREELMRKIVCHHEQDQQPT